MMMCLVIALIYLLLAAVGVGHAVINQRSVATCVTWSLLCLLLPIVGVLVYAIFGIRRMSRQRQVVKATESSGYAVGLNSSLRNHEALVSLADSISCNPLCSGNLITPLVNGACAYPEMLAAIENAQHSIALSTYQFDYDVVGLQFCEALCRAVRRKVQVRVLVDFVGVWLHRSPIVHFLQKGGVHSHYFHPPVSIEAIRYANFRYHRKLLIVDGCLGFTGGMNIRQAHLVDSKLRRVNQDVNFRVEGPAVAQMQSVFAADWLYSAGERLGGAVWFPELAQRGSSIVRGIVSGPDLEVRTNYELLIGVLSCACRNVYVATPYFLPDGALLSSLLAAARKGVEVKLVLSGDNFPIVHWAHLWFARLLLGVGIQLFIAASPFNHAKLMAVDDAWCFVGSSNWNPRSLDMNFEFDLEVYDPHLAGCVKSLIEDKINSAQELTPFYVENISSLAALRNGLARIGCSYL